MSFENKNSSEETSTTSIVDGVVPIIKIKGGRLFWKILKK